MDARATNLLFRERRSRDLRDVEQLGRRLRERAQGVAKHALAERAGGADCCGTRGHEFFRASDVDTGGCVSRGFQGVSVT